LRPVLHEDSLYPKLDNNCQVLIVGINSSAVNIFKEQKSVEQIYIKFHQL